MHEVCGVANMQVPSVDSLLTLPLLRTTLLTTTETLRPEISLRGIQRTSIPNTATTSPQHTTC